MYIYISNKYKVLGQNFERPVKMIGITDSFFLLCCSEQTCRQKYICVYVYCIYVYIYTYVLFFRNSMCTEKRKLSIVFRHGFFLFDLFDYYFDFLYFLLCFNIFLFVKSTCFSLLMFERTVFTNSKFVRINLTVWFPYSMFLKDIEVL